MNKDGFGNTPSYRLSQPTVTMITKLVVILALNTLEALSPYLKSPISGSGYSIIVSIFFRFLIGLTDSLLRFL